MSIISDGFSGSLGMLNRLVWKLESTSAFDVLMLQVLYFL